ncbi:MAG TPA: enoyl-ACP reductase [Gammaproteobacteria bacterium]|nr:enoyl-ACP reductase [Gammaproteobacteria bacterium]
MGFLSGKKILVTGVLSDRSIASGIAEALIREGAEIALTYQNENIRARVEDIAKTLGVKILIPCDVGSDEEITKTFTELHKHWPNFDGFVHSIGFAPRDQLEGDFVEKTSREGFKIAHDISSYSFTALARAALPMLNPNSSLLTLTYLGSEKAMPSYNVMGLAKASLEANVRYMAASLGPKKIRVNAISAGPIKTLAASGVSGLRKMLAHNAHVSPLRENVTIEQVGNTAAFLCSDLSSGITAEIIHVDAGFHAIAMGELV